MAAATAILPAPIGAKGAAHAVKFCAHPLQKPLMTGGAYLRIISDFAVDARVNRR
jgi:hypothetical protein